MSTRTGEVPATPDPVIPLIAVAVYRDGLPLYLLDAAGNALVSDAPADRAAAAALLARAALALANAPPVEPITFGDHALRAADALGRIGTPEAEAALAALGDAVELHATALEMANAVLVAAAPITH